MDGLIRARVARAALFSALPGGGLSLLLVFVLADETLRLACMLAASALLAMARLLGVAGAAARAPRWSCPRGRQLFLELLGIAFCALGAALAAVGLGEENDSWVMSLILASAAQFRQPGRHGLQWNSFPLQGIHRRVRAGIVGLLASSFSWSFACLLLGWLFFGSSACGALGTWLITGAFVFSSVELQGILMQDCTSVVLARGPLPTQELLEESRMFPGAFRAMSLAKYGAVCNIPREQRFQVTPDELLVGLGLGQHATVELHGLKKAELNSKQGTVVGYNPQTQRWTVRLHDGKSEVALLSTKLVVERAARTGTFRLETLLIDVRDNEDFVNYHIPGAINIPYSKMFMDQQRTLSKLKEWNLATTRIVTYATHDSKFIHTTVGRDLSASNWLWEILGHPLTMLATLSGGFAGWVKEGRPVEAGSMSEGGPRKIFVSEDVPKAFSGDKDAYLRASEKEAAGEAKPVSDIEELRKHADSSAIGEEPAQKTAVKAASEVLEGPSMWEVVGGADKGGIVVRKSRDTASEQEPQRLATGALIEQRQLVGERLHYVLHRGEGPIEGWVSIRLKTKDLVVKTSRCLPAEANTSALCHPLGNHGPGLARWAALTSLAQAVAFEHKGHRFQSQLYSSPQVPLLAAEVFGFSGVVMPSPTSSTPWTAPAKPLKAPVAENRGLFAVYLQSALQVLREFSVRVQCLVASSWRRGPKALTAFQLQVLEADVVELAPLMRIAAAGLAGWICLSRDLDERGVVQREEALSKVIYELCGSLRALERAMSLRGFVDLSHSTACALSGAQEEARHSLYQLLLSFEHCGLDQVVMPPLYKRMLDAVTA
eukprot:s1260_g2.t2